MRMGWLLCSVLVAVVGCASSGARSTTGIFPDDVLQKDLPPPEAPPVEIRSHVERDPSTQSTIYVYTVSNGTPYRITDLHVGLRAKDGANTIRRPPLGLTQDGRMPAESYGAPSGWTLLYDGGSRSLGSLTWTAQEKDAILPGESLTGFRVAVARNDKEYERSHWSAIVTGEPGTYTGELVPGEVVAGDPVDRLGRLSIWPRVSRGGVKLRFRTHRKARPIVAILDSKGEVIRKYPQDKRRLREREIVWDRRDAAGNEAPPGDYFVRVRYGETERYGRVTLVR